MVTLVWTYLCADALARIMRRFHCQCGYAPLPSVWLRQRLSLRPTPLCLLRWRERGCSKHENALHEKPCMKSPLSSPFIIWQPAVWRRRAEAGAVKANSTTGDRHASRTHHARATPQARSGVVGREKSVGRCGRGEWWVENLPPSHPHRTLTTRPLSQLQAPRWTISARPSGPNGHVHSPAS